MKTSGERFKGFDGLRTFAIWMVVAGHIGALANTAGGIGNKIFFTLCGFFACYSMAHVSDGKDILRFYRKKIVRIIPAFWIVLLVIWKMIPGFFSIRDAASDNSLILNMLFIKGWGHLWFTQQIMLMYLCAPFIHLILCGIERLYRKIIPHAESIYPCITAAILIAAALLEKRFFTADLFRMAGDGSHAQFQIWMFLFGYAAAVLCRGWSGQSGRGEVRRQVSPLIVNGFMAAFFGCLLLGVIPSFRTAAPAFAAVFDHGMLRTVLVCIATLLLMMQQDSFAARFLSTPFFHFFSELSYEIYLIHFFFLGMFRTGQNLHDLLSNMLISVALAFLLHTGIRTFSKKKAQSRV